jgi:iron(III) transport system substrate-binding protein
VATVFPSDVCGWDVEANALVKKAAIKPEAKVFLDWALGGEVMKMYAKVYPLTAYPTGGAIPEGYPADPFKILVKNDFQWAAKNRDRILEEWSRRYGSKSEPKK